MSFVKRDGMVVHTGNHVASRGTLESLRHGSSDSPEDEEWVKCVLATANLMNFDEGDPEEIEVISKVWGIYKRANPRFNSDYFEPSGR